MKATDWKNAAKLMQERQSHKATADTSQLSSLPLSKLSLDASGPPTVLEGPFVPLSTSTPICMQLQEDSPYQQVIPGMLSYSLYPILAALCTNAEITIAPPVTFSRRVINDIEEQQGRVLECTVEGIVRSTNTSLILEADDETDDTPIPGAIQYHNVTQANTGEETLEPESLQEDTRVKTVYQANGQESGLTEAQYTSDGDETEVPDINSGQNEEEDNIQEAKQNDNLSDAEETDITVQEDETSRVSQDDNYHTAIADDDLDDTVQFSHPVTEPFLSRNIRIPTTEVGCLSFTQIFQEHLQTYPPASQAEA